MMRTHLQNAPLHLRHPGLTRPISDAFTEAASVCLHRHHRSPAEYEVWYDDGRAALVLEWIAPEERTLAAWANTIDTTEAGAVGVVLAALEQSTGLVAIRRAETRSGADYYVGPAGTGREDLEHCLRLEISGVDRGSASAVYLRVAQKIQQTLRGDSNLPALVGVVGFRVRLIVLESVEDE
jgi:hypothetical protein